MEACVLNARQRRARVVNELLVIIASHGRQFFRDRAVVAEFELDHRGRVWLVQEHGRRVCMHSPYMPRRFSHGGTLWALCNALRAFIVGRAALPLSHLRGDRWGYGEAAMDAVRAEAEALREREGL